MPSPEFYRRYARRDSQQQSRRTPQAHTKLHCLGHFDLCILRGRLAAVPFRLFLSFADFRTSSSNPGSISMPTRSLSRLLCLLLLVSTATVGCVRRRLTIRSNPPGAMVIIDDQQIGTTPVSTYFTYYGTRKIKLVKDGFETATALETIRPPWYQVPPLDLISENFIGRELRDERVLDFQLQPQRLVPTQELLQRASALRGGALQGVMTPEPLVPRVVDPSQVPGPLPLWEPNVAPETP